MERKKEFVSDVTEFPIENPEEEVPSRFGLDSLTKFFSFGRSTSDFKRAEAEKSADSDKNDTSSVDSFPNPGTDGRSLPNVLQRISSLVAVKEGTTSEKNLKMYWLPDSFSNECYDCSEKFTAFRRRHHCRVCGQIFCSRCCNQRIPGKIMQCTGDLRVCTYCCKVVLSYLESANMSADLSADLRSLQEDLQVKLGSRIDQQRSVITASQTSLESTTSKRKISLGYQEERFVLGRAPSSSVLSDEERCQALQMSTSLRSLFEEILDTVTGVPLHTFQYLDKEVQGCLTGSSLIDWLIANSKSANRVQALAMGQMLLEAGYLQATYEHCFTDGDSRYRVMRGIVSPPLLPAHSRWGAATDSESERISEGDECGGIGRSRSSYELDIDVGEKVVHLARPSPPHIEIPTEDTKSPARKKISDATEAEVDSSVFLDSPPNPENTGERTGWHRADHLVRPENEEAESYFRLCSIFEFHQINLLNQLLRSAGLNESWSSAIIPIAQTIVHQIRVAHRIYGEMDIRMYAQIKILPGGCSKDIRVVPGVVCSKNVAHRAMKTRIDNARILILQCPLVYQRVEGRMQSLEPVMIAEHEYLRHVVARIASLNPDVVLAHKNVSRLAQEYLLDLGITLVLNVKLSVLERVSRLTGADMMTTVDAHVGNPQLGTCSSFFLETFELEDGQKKTLMFFEGNPELRCTVLLRGGNSSQLKNLKKVLSFAVLSEYNWRLEKSFLMDEHARPPSPPRQLFQDSPTCSLAEKLAYQSNSAKSRIASVSSIESIVLDSIEGPLASVEQRSSEVKLVGITKASMPCENDPLQCEEFGHSPVADSQAETVRLAVAELPQKNKFRTALDDTIISISPLLRLSVPYMESDSGKNCPLRCYFPKMLYTSNLFEEQKNDRKNLITSELPKPAEVHDITPKHEFLTAKLTEDVSSSHVQTLLALYRASGGNMNTRNISRLRKKKAPTATPAVVPTSSERDVLDPFEHQQFSVLFCSYSGHSSNAPAFCVDPWVVKMMSYGPNDIPLGWFLEFYCFRPTACCPSKTCQLPLNQHIRRFVHDAGAICLTLNTLPRELKSTDIWMWNCCVCCKLSSQRVPMTSDTWSLSFAKYLELRFLGDSYNRRGPDGCRHSLHHQHAQYFALGNLVATFLFLPISVKWEISLPPPLILIAPSSNPLGSAVDDLRSLAIKGYDVFSSILTYIVGLETLSEDELQALKQQQQKEQAAFKHSIEEIQVCLTSPSIESKRFEPGAAKKDAEMHLLRVENSIILLKRFICECVVGWNSRLMDSKRKEDRAKRSSDGNVKSHASAILLDANSCKEDEDSTAGDSEDPPWDKNSDNFEVVDSEDNLSFASHPEDGKERKDEPPVDLKTDKKSVKTLLTQILTPSKDTAPIEGVWSPHEHYLLPPGVNTSVIVIETEPSSIIAYALASHDHKRHIEDKNTLPPPVPENAGAASPLYRRKTLSSSSSGEKEHQSDPATSPNHCDVPFSDSFASFNCRVYYAEEFKKFRSVVFPLGEDYYIRSLSHCAPWTARGGKSGSSFCKTKDDRFVIKQIVKIEVSSFLDFVPQYLAYITRCHEEQKPTLLGKILGVYTVTLRNSSGLIQKSNLLVMENLFYQRAVSHKYDLKGSVRNRLANPDSSKDSEIVYMDENLLKLTCEAPLYAMHHSQSILMKAIESDTEFLSAQDVMDYSLLVGLDKDRSELVVGIIDYIRTFTWDKRLENMVKTSVIMGNPGKQPTIVQPKEYRERFIAAMKRYFLPVPDRWYGFNNTFQ